MWPHPTHPYAHLQIARIHIMVRKLGVGNANGEAEAISRFRGPSSDPRLQRLKTLACSNSWIFETSGLVPRNGYDSKHDKIDLSNLEVLLTLLDLVLD